MGYRISLYRCPKKDVDEIRDITNEDVEKSGWGIFDVLEKDQIKYDTLANVLDTENYIVTPKEIDEVIQIVSDIISSGINMSVN